MGFQLLTKTKMLKKNDFLALKLLDVIHVFCMLINVKMTLTVGILTFMSMIDSMLS